MSSSAYNVNAQPYIQQIMCQPPHKKLVRLAMHPSWFMIQWTHPIMHITAPSVAHQVAAMTLGSTTCCCLSPPALRTPCLQMEINLWCCHRAVLQQLSQHPSLWTWKAGSTGCASPATSSSEAWIDFYKFSGCSKPLQHVTAALMTGSTRDQGTLVATRFNGW